MTLFCDKCGGARINGAPVTLDDDGNTVLAHGGTPNAEIVGRYCRDCIKKHDITLYA